MTSKIIGPMQLKLQPGVFNIRMREDAVPSKFACQAPFRSQHSLPTSGSRLSSVGRAERISRAETVEVGFVF